MPAEEGSICGKPRGGKRERKEGCSDRICEDEEETGLYSEQTYNAYLKNLPFYPFL